MSFVVVLYWKWEVNVVYVFARPAALPILAKPPAISPTVFISFSFKSPPIATLNKLHHTNLYNSTLSISPLLFIIFDFVDSILIPTCFHNSSNLLFSYIQP